MIRAATSALKNALLAYAASYGVHERTAQRKVAAQLWRALPRGLAAAEAVSWLDAQVSHWAFALIGEPMRAAEVRAAFLSGGLDPAFLLRPHDGTPAYSALVRQLDAARPLAVPGVTLMAMPLQEVAPVALAQWLLSPVPASQRQPARA